MTNKKGVSTAALTPANGGQIATPKTPAEIRELIVKLEEGNKYILDQKMATVQINAYVSLAQLKVIGQLDVLYWCLGEERPRFKYDEK